MRDVARDRGLGVLFVSVFVATWIGQLVFEWLEYARRGGRPRPHGGVLVEGLLGRLLAVDARELAVGVPPAFRVHDRGAYLVYKGSSESSDGTERIEAKLDFSSSGRGSDPEGSRAPCRPSCSDDDHDRVAAPRRQLLDARPAQMSKSTKS